MRIPQFKKDKNWLKTLVTVCSNGCWLINKIPTKSGYCLLWFEGKNQLAHRVSFKLFKGVILKGLCVCHSCDIRNCVNPDHLWLGTLSDNQQDSIKKGRFKTLFTMTDQKGENNANHKLTWEIVARIRKDYSTGEYSKRAIGRKYGISDRGSRFILDNIQWRI